MKFTPSLLIVEVNILSPCQSYPEINRLTNQPASTIASANQLSRFSYGGIFQRILHISKGSDNDPDASKGSSHKIEERVDLGPYRPKIEGGLLVSKLISFDLFILPANTETGNKEVS